MNHYRELRKAARPYRGSVRIDRIRDPRSDYTEFNATFVRVDGTTLHMFVCGDSTGDVAAVVANFRTKMEAWA